VTRAEQLASAIAALERIVAAGGDADDVLRDAVTAVHEHVPDYTRVGLRFSEAGDLVLGPNAGDESGQSAAEPVIYNGERVGQFEVASSHFDETDRTFLERVASLIALHTLLGWDTGGAPWDP
jgi:putative methionine-R-sulfoxide reductase with GAF domain